MGVELLRAHGVRVVVLAEDGDDTAVRRSAKLDVPCYPLETDPAEQIEQIARDQSVSLAQVAYVGYDDDDLPALRRAGTGAVVADAHPRAIEAAGQVLSMPGGRGAVREVCDLILSQGIFRPS